MFKRPPRLGFGLIGDRPPEPVRLIVELDPSTGIRLGLDARRAHAAPPVHPYAPGGWGPEAADRLVAGHPHWHELWIAS